MPKIRTPLTIDERALRAAEIRTARTGGRDSDLIEDAVRGDLGLDVLDEIWAGQELSEDQAMGFALEAQDAVRRAA